MSAARPDPRPEPGPRVVTRRAVALPLRRTLDISVVEDSYGRVDVWWRQYSPDGRLVGQLHSKPSALRAIAAALGELAGELGIAP
jgi:hypothetical protein